MQKIKYFLLTKTVGLFLNLLSYVSPKHAVKLAYRLFSEPRIGRLNQAQLPEVLQNAQRETSVVNFTPLTLHNMAKPY